MMSQETLGCGLRLVSATQQGPFMFMNFKRGKACLDTLSESLNFCVCVFLKIKQG